VSPASGGISQALAGEILPENLIPRKPRQGEALKLCLNRPDYGGSRNGDLCL
jgi:hypothetical protein